MKGMMTSKLIYVSGVFGSNRSLNLTVAVLLGRIDQSSTMSPAILAWQRRLYTMPFSLR
jgi:hypothetical protein